MKSLPSLAHLQAVEAAARHMSFQKAASELHLTASAVSHRIKAYEALTGITFFQRKVRGIRLTARGEKQLPIIQRILADYPQLINDAPTTNIRSQQKPVLRLSVPSLFFSQLVLPNLADFKHRYSTIDLDIHITAARRPLKRFDMAVCYGKPELPQWSVTKMFVGHQIPVFSGKIYRQLPKANPEQFLLTHFPLIALAYSPKAWQHYLDRLRIHESTACNKITANNMAEALTAALSGLGVAIAIKELVADELANKTLFTIPNMVIGKDSFYLAKRKESSASSTHTARWLKELANKATRNVERL